MKRCPLCRRLKHEGDFDRTALTLLQEVSRDRRTEEINKEREAKNSEPATASQLKYMKKLGIEVPSGVTKRDASMLIDEELAKNVE